MFAFVVFLVILFLTFGMWVGVLAGMWPGSLVIGTIIWTTIIMSVVFWVLNKAVLPGSKYNWPIGLFITTAVVSMYFTSAWDLPLDGALFVSFCAAGYAMLIFILYRLVGR